MADKLHGAVKAGSTDVSIPIELRKTADATGETGIVAAGVTASYWRQGGSRTAISVSNLSAITDAHTDGGWFEVDATNTPGLYRFDLPDAAVATGVDFVVITIKTTASLRHVILPLESENAATLNADTDSIKAKTDALPSAVKKNTAFANFPFQLVLLSDHVTPATGKSPTGKVSKDGGSFNAISGSPTYAEIAEGWYKVSSIPAGDLNADVVILVFEAAGCDDRSIVLFPKA